MVTVDWLQKDQQSATACCTWRSGCLMRSKAGAHSCSNFSRVITILLGNGCGQTDAMSIVALKLLDSFLCRTAFSMRRGPQCCNAFFAVLKGVFETMHSMQHKPETEDAADSR